MPVLAPGLFPLTAVPQVRLAILGSLFPTMHLSLLPSLMHCFTMLLLLPQSPLPPTRQCPTLPPYTPTPNPVLFLALDVLILRK